MTGATMLSRPAYEPFPGIPLGERAGQLSYWLAEDDGISTFELWCLLLKVDQCCREFESAGQPLPARLVQSRRVVLRALNIRKGVVKRRR